MYQCQSGRHWWLTQESAERCCDPAWRRVLVVQQPGQALPADVGNITVAGGVLCGRVWKRVEPEVAHATIDA